MNLPVNVGDRVVHHLVGVIAGKPVIGLQSIAVQARTYCHVVAHEFLKISLARADHLGANLPTAFKPQR